MRVTQVTDVTHKEREWKRLRGWYTRFQRPVPVRVNVVMCMTCLQESNGCRCPAPQGASHA